MAVSKLFIVQQDSVVKAIITHGVMSLLEDYNECLFEPIWFSFTGSIDWQKKYEAERELSRKKEIRIRELEGE